MVLINGEDRPVNCFKKEQGLNYLNKNIGWLKVLNGFV